MQKPDESNPGVDGRDNPQISKYSARLEDSADRKNICKKPRYAIEMTIIKS